MVRVRNMRETCAAPTNPRRPVNESRLLRNPRNSPRNLSFTHAANLTWWATRRTAWYGFIQPTSMLQHSPITPQALSRGDNACKKSPSRMGMGMATPPPPAYAPLPRAYSPPPYFCAMPSKQGEE